MSDVSDHSVYVSDVSGGVVFWNEGATNLFGWKESEVVGGAGSAKRESAFFPPDDRERGECDRERDRAVADGVVMGERWYVRRDGSSFVGNSTLLPLYDAESDGEAGGGVAHWFVRVVQDVTDNELHHVRLETSLNHQLRVTRKLQETQLPTLTQTLDGLEVAALCRPVVVEERVGGDFYDAMLLADGGVALFVGDASGKGLAASAAATEARYSLRAFLREDPDPARAVSRVNDMLCRSATLENRVAAGFTTLTLIVAYAERGMGRLVHAGGEFPVLIPADGAAHESGNDSRAGIGLSIMPGYAYAATEFPLGHGDMILLFTDGITESRRGNSFLGTDGIFDAIRDVRNRTHGGAMGARSVDGDVLREANRFHAGTFRDDMCLLAARATR